MEQKAKKYIDRAELKRRLEAAEKGYLEAHADEDTQYFAEGLAYAIDILMNMPTCRYKTTARWETQTEGVRHYTKCTGCNSLFELAFDDFVYCPNCGAHMEMEIGDKE